MQTRLLLCDKSYHSYCMLSQYAMCLLPSGVCCLHICWAFTAVQSWLGWQSTVASRVCAAGACSCLQSTGQTAFLQCGLHCCRREGLGGMSHRWMKALPITYSLFSGMIGTQSVLFSKALSTLLRTTLDGDSQLDSWFFWLVLVLFLCCAYFWVTSLNKVRYVNFVSSTASAWHVSFLVSQCLVLLATVNGVMTSVSCFVLLLKLHTH